jgi:predicted phosphoribosyltransferase
MNKSVKTPGYFASRFEAGETLAHQLKSLPLENPIVLAISPDAIPVAFPVAEALHCPLDLVLGFKITHPHHPEVALGVVTERDFFSQEPDPTFRRIPAEELRKILIQETARLASQARIYSKARPQISLLDRDVLLVGEGASTGFTAHAVAETVRLRGARTVLLALPYCTRQAANKLRELGSADQLLIQREAENELAPADWYPQDERVLKKETIIELLNKANHPELFEPEEKVAA